MVGGNCEDCGAEVASENHRFCEQCGLVLTASTVGPKEEVNTEELNQNNPPNTEIPTPPTKRVSNETYKMFGIYGENKKTKTISGKSILIPGSILVIVAAVTLFALRSNSTDGISDKETICKENNAPEQIKPVASSESVPSVLHPPAEVRVLVANGTDVAGAAGDTLDNLVAYGGYNGVGAVMAITEGIACFTFVYYENGYDLDAQNIRLIINADSANVRPMPAALPVTDLVGADVLVYVGSDLYPR